MDTFLKDFSLIGVCSLAVALVVATALIRKIMELALPVLVKTEVYVTKTHKVTKYQNGWARVYNELFLYLLPYILGALIALSKTAFIFGSIEKYTGRLIFSVLVATFSGIFYKSVKKSIPRLFGLQEESDDSSDVLGTPPSLPGMEEASKVTETQKE